MECPKCGHQQTGTEKCEACDIYFAKYQAIQERLKNQQTTPRKGKGRRAAAANPERGGSKLWLGAAVILAIVAGSALFDEEDAAPVTPVATTPDPKPTPSGLMAQLAASHPPGNAIEKARNATVFIETPWGSLGSGFIVSNDCTVVTNRHVIDFNEDLFRSAIYNDQSVKSTVRQETMQRQARFHRLSNLRDQLMMSGASQAEIDAINEELQALSQSINSLPGDLTDAIEEQVEDMALTARTQPIIVSVVDGTEFKVSKIRRSEGHDLASFSLPAENCPSISLSTSSGLRQGDRVYTIGSPSGLTYTVTSGIFSGNREMGDFTALQTDAPINPGNSGGPLVREDGSVIGINTAILEGASGIGFAIPIELARKELSL